MSRSKKLIELLGLKPHPEGGYYRETYRSSECTEGTNLPARYGGRRNLGTAIYYLLEENTFSSMHRIKSDEVFHFYLGDPVLMLRLYPDGAGETLTLGSDIEAGMLPQAVVPAGVWQGAKLVPGGRFALMGTTVAPGFDFNDFETGGRHELVSKYPAFSDILLELTHPK